MGWTGITTKTPPKGELAMKKFFEKEFGKEILAIAVSGEEVHMAIRSEGRVFAITCIVSYNRSREEFLYKDMDETMGPFYYKCPNRILDLLTVTENVSAITWRRSCRKMNERRN
jgi:hypothetical protein